MTETPEDRLRKLEAFVVNLHRQITAIQQQLQLQQRNAATSLTVVSALEGILLAGRMAKGGQDWLVRARSQALAQIPLDDPEAPMPFKIEARRMVEDLFDRIELAGAAKDDPNKLN